jgi:hypothetical protein
MSLARSGIEVRAPDEFAKPPAEMSTASKKARSGNEPFKAGGRQPFFSTTAFCYACMSLSLRFAAQGESGRFSSARGWRASISDFSPYHRFLLSASVFAWK